VNAEFRCHVKSTIKLKIALKTLVNATVLNLPHQMFSMSVSNMCIW